jgi:hypothetical protein
MRYLEISYSHTNCEKKSVASIVWSDIPLFSMRLGIGIRHPPQNEIYLVYRLPKNHTPKREVATLIFTLKLEVFGPNMPYGPHRR